MCSKKRLFRIGSDVEEDEKTAKAVLKDQQELVFRENTTTHCLQSEVCRAVQGELKIWRIINNTLFFLCSKKKLFNTESDVEEDEKTVKAVLEDQR